MTTKKRAATLFILMLVGLTGLVNAQMSTTFKAQVPFDFVANGKTMPAGECIIAVENNGRVLSIRSGEQHSKALVAYESWNTTKETAFVFHLYATSTSWLVSRTQGKLAMHWLRAD